MSNKSVIKKDLPGVIARIVSVKDVVKKELLDRESSGIFDDLIGAAVEKSLEDYDFYGRVKCVVSHALNENIDSYFRDGDGAKAIKEMSETIIEDIFIKAGLKGAEDKFFKLKLFNYSELSFRTQCALSSNNIETVGDLCSKKEWHLLRIKGFGKSSLEDVKQFLKQFPGLALGMDVPKKYLTSKK